MAPNQKRTQLHLTTVDLSLVQPIKAGFPPLTSEVPPTPANSVTSPQQQQQDSSEYWEWSSENDAEINQIVEEERLSADHIVDNILRQPAVAQSNTCSSNDQYWDWSHAKQNESIDYWNWPATSRDEEQQSSTATGADSDSYWAW